MWTGRPASPVPTRPAATQADVIDRRGSRRPAWRLALLDLGDGHRACHRRGCPHRCSGSENECFVLHDLSSSRQCRHWGGYERPCPVSLTRATLRLSRSRHKLVQTGAVEWPLLAGLPEDDVRQLLSIARRRHVREGRGGLPSRRPGRDAAPRRARSLRRARADTGRRQRLLDVIGPGRAFGELALFRPDSRRSATVSALEEGETRSVSGPTSPSSSAAIRAEGRPSLPPRRAARARSDRILEAHYVDAERASETSRRARGDVRARRRGDGRPADPGDLAAWPARPARP